MRLLDNEQVQVFVGDSSMELAELLENKKVDFIDLFNEQKQELKKTLLFGKSEGDQEEYLSGAEATYVYYPWDNKLLKILSESDFKSVRSSRNRYKITEQEQELLETKKVGVIGLSVGRTVSLALSLERIYGELRLADFDHIELSNLNRLNAPLKDYRLDKTVSTKRELLGFDPYLQVNCFHDGLTRDNLDDFFSANGKLDLVIDECDSLEVKILIRKKAKELGIPVLMDTSDRGMIDIERYDLDENLRYFNGLIGDFDPPYSFELTQEERNNLLMQIIDFSNLSDRAKLSLGEMGKTISTWPQLASSVTMGGGTTCHVARRILLGETVQSGRYYIDLTELIPNAKRG